MSVDRKRWSRLGIALGATIAMGVAAAPAYAEPDPGLVSAQLDDVTIGAAGASRKVRPMIVVAANATDPKVVLDLSKLDGVATVDFPGDGCAVDGKTATCELPSGKEFRGVIEIGFRPAAGAKAGDTGSITYAASAAGLPPAEREAKVTIADGPDILVSSGGEKLAAALGDKVKVPVVFINAGSKAAVGVKMIFKFSQGLVPDAYGNCVYADWLDVHGRLVECTFQNVIEPAGTYKFDGGFGALVGPTAFGDESVGYTVDPIARAPALAQRLEAQSKGGPELQLVPISAETVDAGTVDIDATDNVGEFLVTDITNTTDVAGVGATVSGQVGATVQAKIGLRNNGAASLDSFGFQESVILFAFTVPSGVEVVTVPDGCTSITAKADGTFTKEPGKTGGTYYVCEHPDTFFGAGETLLLEFGLKIMSSSTGSVSADVKTNNPVVYADDKPANNAAAVTVTVTTTGGGGTLPITGRQTGLITGTGAALLAIGTLLLFAARRRGPTTG